jgi:hypothetical protein
MDAYDRCTNLGKKKDLANGVTIYCGGREIFRPPMYRWLVGYLTMLLVSMESLIRRFSEK